jgi:hypothetical protein
VKEAVALQWGRCWRDAVIGCYAYVKRDVKITETASRSPVKMPKETIHMKRDL